MQHYVDLVNVKNEVKTSDMKMECKFKAHVVKTRKKIVVL